MSKILVLGRTMDMGGTEVAMAALLQKLVDGERMETKMLFPMFLLLGLVMAIVMIPAFMSM